MARTFRAVTLWLALAAPAIPAAAETCPWLNAATAGGVLGGAVTATVTHANANREDATCSFVRTGAQLTIEVVTMDTPRSEYTAHAAQCGSDPVALKAIGNEAVACTDEHGAKVVSRVRNKIFTIIVASSDPPATLREKARSVAEQVAGNLF